MNRRGLVLLGLLILALVALSVTFEGSKGGAGGSSLNFGSEGWRAARAYLEGEGKTVELWDRPPEEATTGLPTSPEDAALRKSPEEQPARPVLVTVLPWGGSSLPLDSFEDHLRHGGVLVVGYSGRSPSRHEEWLLESLDLTPERARRRPPLDPRAWRRYVDTEEWLRPAPSWASQQAPHGTPRDSPLGGLNPVRIRALDYAPGAPKGAQELYLDDDGRARIFSYPLLDGQVVVLPAETLSNGRLSEAGNGDLLATLAVSLGDAWAFDERGHGLVPAEAGVQALPPVSFDLLPLHLALLYGLAVWALARRFGPAWREPRDRGSAAGDFLFALGRLHHQMEHHRTAARLLIERRQALHPSLEIPPRFHRRAAEVAEADQLVALAGDLARWSHRGPQSPTRPPSPEGPVSGPVSGSVSGSLSGTVLSDPPTDAASKGKP